jgi:uncharacterized membrane protein (TIGR02234 family)
MPDRMVSNRLRSSAGFALTLGGGLLGALAVAVAVARPWVQASAEVAGLPTITVEVSGATLRPLTGALGLVLLASFGAVVATRGWLRRSFGILIVAAAAVVLASALLPIDDAGAVEEALAAKGWSQGDYDTTSVGWRWLAAAGATVCVLAGLAVALLGAGWPTMGSRYDAPTANRSSRSAADSSTARAKPADGAEENLDEAELWRSLDRGHDPTRDA